MSKFECVILVLAILLGIFSAVVGFLKINCRYHIVADECSYYTDNYEYDKDNSSVHFVDFWNDEVTIYGEFSIIEQMP